MEGKFEEAKRRKMTVFGKIKKIKERVVKIMNPIEL